MKKTYIQTIKSAVIAFLLSTTTINASYEADPSAAEGGALAAHSASRAEETLSLPWMSPERFPAHSGPEVIRLVQYFHAYSTDSPERKDSPAEGNSSDEISFH